FRPLSTTVLAPLPATTVVRTGIRHHQPESDIELEVQPGFPFVATAPSCSANAPDNHILINQASDQPAPGSEQKTPMPDIGVFAIAATTQTNADALYTNRRIFREVMLEMRQHVMVFILPTTVCVRRNAASK